MILAAEAIQDLERDQMKNRYNLQQEPQLPKQCCCFLECHPGWGGYQLINP